MKITTSYKIKITGDTAALDNSIRIYRDVLKYMIPIINEH